MAFLFLCVGLLVSAQKSGRKLVDNISISPLINMDSENQNISFLPMLSVGNSKNQFALGPVFPLRYELYLRDPNRSYKNLKGSPGYCFQYQRKLMEKKNYSNMLLFSFQKSGYREEANTQYNNDFAVLKQEERDYYLTVGNRNSLKIINRLYFISDINFGFIRVARVHSLYVPEWGDYVFKNSPQNQYVEFSFMLNVGLRYSFAL
jgi:hypothetical protein